MSVNWNSILAELDNELAAAEASGDDDAIEEARDRLARAEDELDRRIDRMKEDR